VLDRVRSVVCVCFVSADVSVRYFTSMCLLPQLTGAGVHSGGWEGGGGRREVKLPLAHTFTFAVYAS
jgi:hypothetical protein